MAHKRDIWKLAAFGLLVLALAVVVACGGVSQTEFDAAKKDAADQAQKAAALQQQLSSNIQQLSQLQQQVAAKEGDVKKAQDQLAAKEKELDDLQKAAGKLAGATVLQYSKIVPTPTPRPTPTPLPAGVTPPPAAKPDAAFLNEVLPFAIYAETLGTTSVSKYGYAAYGYNEFSLCNPQAIFNRGSKLVWRFEVIDTSTGKRITSEEGATVKVKVPGIDAMTARYSKRAGVGPWTWAVGWDIPPDYPLGSLDWSITVATKDGRNYEWRPPFVNKPGTETSRPEDSRVQIVP
ncbi:MAG: hypothetical protein HYY00_03715 [Chloroflexi bacterium]|nr:hypothetical protein [Chloroflexota bacterium]